MKTYSDRPPLHSMRRSTWLACDLVRRARPAGGRLVTWLGGSDGETVRGLQVVTHGPADAMAQAAARFVGEGFRRLKVKSAAMVMTISSDRGRAAAVRRARDLLRCQFRLDAVKGAAFGTDREASTYTFEQPARPRRVPRRSSRASTSVWSRRVGSIAGGCADIHEGVATA